MESHQDEQQHDQSDENEGAEVPPPPVLNLDTIPIEVLLQIFNFVDATYLLRNVTLVSKYFHAILSNEMTWKIKMEKRWGGTEDTKFPPIDLLPDDDDDEKEDSLEPEEDQKDNSNEPKNGNGDEEKKYTDPEDAPDSTQTKDPSQPSSTKPEDPISSPSPYTKIFTTSRFPWSRSCVKREEQIKLWNSNSPQQQNLQHSTLQSHIGCIDSIHLFNKNNSMLLASGSRDRTISLWNVEQALNSPEDSNASKIKVLNRAHDGWIWDFAVNSSNLMSCSWDTTAKIWDLNTAQCTAQFKSTSALLSISSTNTTIALGSFNRKILLLDPRTEISTPTATFPSTHTRSVLSVGLDNTYLISCGEDGLLARHDLRTKKLLEKINLPSSPNTRTYPTCMSFRETLINLPYFYIGDNTGTLHLIDLLNFSITHSKKLHASPVRGVFNNLGSVVSCSRDGKLIVSSSCLGLTKLKQVDVGDKIELPCVHSLDNVVACGGGDGAIRIWGSTTAVL